MERAVEIAARIPEAELGAGRGAAGARPRAAWRCDGQPSGLEDLLRELAPQVLGVLVRRYGEFDACEDARAGGAARGGARSGRPTGVPANPPAG